MEYSKRFFVTVGTLAIFLLGVVLRVNHNLTCLECTANLSMSAGKASTVSAAANLAKLCIGVGVLALPYATSIGGLVFAPLIIGLVAYWNGVACKMMVECKNACADVAFPENLSSTYSKIAYAGAGKMGVMITDLSIIVTLLGVCIAYQITFTQLLQQIDATNYSTPVLAVVFAVLALPLCCVDNVGVLAMFSALGLVCLIVSVVAIIVYGVAFYGSAALTDPFGNSDQDANELHLINHLNDSHRHLSMWPESISSMSSFIGVATFCFGLCSLAFPVEESMQNKKEFGKAVTWSLIFVWFVYVLLGDVGAILFVHDTAKGIRDNILSNLPVDSFVAFLVRLAMAGVSLLTYPLTLVPPAHMLEHYMLSYSCFPSLTVSDSVEEGLSTTRGSARNNGYGALEMADVTDSEAGTPTPLSSEMDLFPAAVDGSESHREVSFYMRCANRFLIVVMTTVISTWIPCFGMVIALLGGFTVTILSFILPSYLHLQIVGYQNIHGAPSSSSICAEDSSHVYGKGSLLSTSTGNSASLEISSEARRSIINTDIALTVGGVAMCVISTAVTTIGFMSRVSSEGGSCT